ncbi:hypothetical protein LTR36_010353, partial [Oleoguttula mirabilis]
MLLASAASSNVSAAPSPDLAAQSTGVSPPLSLKPVAAPELEQQLDELLAIQSTVYG